MDIVDAPFTIEIRPRTDKGFIEAKLIPHQKCKTEPVLLSTFSLDIAIKDKAMFQLWAACMAELSRMIAKKIAGEDCVQIVTHTIKPSDLN